jgi:hypothetical protein
VRIGELLGPDVTDEDRTRDVMDAALNPLADNSRTTEATER